jgi:DNA polymerase-3 subunit delta
LVLTTAQKKGLDKLEAAVSLVGIVVGFAAPGERDAPRWLQERAQLKDKKLSSQAASLILELVGLDLHRLENELDKLVTYVGNREAIEADDVQETVSYQRSFSVFELLGFVSRGDRSRAVHSLRSLIRAGEPPLAILALMSRQIRILWQSKEALANGVSISELSRHLRLPQFVVKNYAQESSLFSETELHKIHTAIREADLALKGTGSSPELIMENLVLKIAQPTGLSTDYTD